MPREPPVSEDRRLSADRVPTLTEVVELDLMPGARADENLDLDASLAPPALPEFSLDIPDLRVVDPALAAPSVEPGDEVASDEPVIEVVDDVEEVEEVEEVEDVEEVERAMEAAAGAGQGALPTEVDLSAEAVLPPTAAAEAPSEVPPAGPPAPMATDARPVPPEVDLDALVDRVLSELMPRIDMLLESRLREALAPALARAADGLIRDTRDSLPGAVRELVQDTVARALQRRTEL